MGKSQGLSLLDAARVGLPGSIKEIEQGRLASTIDADQTDPVTWAD